MTNVTYPYVYNNIVNMVKIKYPNVPEITLV